MLKTEIAELMGKDGAENTLYEVAQKVEYGYDKLNAEEKEVFEVADAWAKEIGKTGKDNDNQIAQFINKVVNEEIYNTDDALLDILFERGTIGEFDDVEYTKQPKNTLEAYEAAKGGTVDRSFIDFGTALKETKNRQVETDITYTQLRKNGFKSIATLTTYAKEALQNALFYDVFSAIDTNLISENQVFSVTTGAAPTQAAIDAFTLYLTDIDASNAIGVGLTKYTQKIARMTGYFDSCSDKMKEEYNRYGLVKFYDGVKFAGISGYKKTGKGQLLIPDKRLFGCAGKIGGLDMKGEIHTYEDFDNSNDKVIIRVKDFTYTYAITDIDKCCKITFTA